MGHDSADQAQNGVFQIPHVVLRMNWWLDYTIIKIVRNLRPWIGLSLCLSAHSTLELNSGEAQRLNLQVGQKLKG